MKDKNHRFLGEIEAPQQMLLVDFCKKGFEISTALVALRELINFRPLPVISTLESQMKPRQKKMPARFDQLRQLRSLLAEHCENIKQSPYILFGYQSDPFVSQTKHLDTILEAIELMASYQPPMLLLRTRSPLIILATPVLRAISGETLITLAVESDRNSNEKVFPGHPSSTERFQTAEALRDIGLAVHLQAAPLPAYRSAKSIEVFAKNIDRAAEFVSVHNYNNLCGSEIPAEELKGNSRILHSALVEFAPGKVFQPKDHSEESQVAA